MLTHRRTRAAGATSVALALLALPACGSDDAAADDTATSAPTSDATSAAGPAQPKGPDGVTVRVSNYADHADDEVVRSVIGTMQALYASPNRGTLLPRFREGASKDVQRQVQSSLAIARRENLHQLSTIRAKVEAADAKSVRLCVWGPDEAFRTSDDQPYTKRGPVSQGWNRYVLKTTTTSGGRIVLTDLAGDGSCPGGAPA